MNIVSAARELGIEIARPEILLPDGLQAPKDGHARALAAIAAHLDDLEFQIEQLEESGGNGAVSPRQIELVTRYRAYVALTIRTIRAAIETGSTIALDVLDRASGTLVTATRQLFATVRASASAATAKLKSAAATLRPPVQGVIRSVGTLVKRVIGKSAAESPPPLPEDYVEQAKVMILAGEVPPANWVPHLTKLDFSDTKLADIAPLASLTALQSLDLTDTQVSDVAPLASLTALQGLDLTGTQVSDVAPLASLTALQRLYLTGTPVSDVAPLASLTALQDLGLRGTPVSDVAPLASLTALQGS